MKHSELEKKITHLAGGTGKRGKVGEWLRNERLRKRGKSKEFPFTG